MDCIFLKLEYMEEITSIKNQPNAANSTDVGLLWNFHLHVSAGDQGHLQGDISVKRIQCDSVTKCVKLPRIIEIHVYE